MLADAVKEKREKERREKEQKEREKRKKFKEQAMLGGNASQQHVQHSATLQVKMSDVLPVLPLFCAWVAADHHAVCIKPVVPACLYARHEHCAQCTPNQGCWCKGGLLPCCGVMLPKG